VSVSNRNNTINGIDVASLEILEQWKTLLDIEDWLIIYEPITEMQVVDELKGDTPGHEFVGIAINSSARRDLLQMPVLSPELVSDYCLPKGENVQDLVVSMSGSR